MNIHFKDEGLFKDLKARTIVCAPIGSRFYGDNREDSDYDYLNIYIPDRLELCNPFLNHHQFQYKSVNKDGIVVDDIFTSLPQFFKNLTSGDSTINFEVLFTEEFKKVFPELSYKQFETYNIAKAYLGFAKRDLKQYSSGDMSKERHILRGLQTAKNIINKVSTNKWVYKNTWAARLHVVEDHMRRYELREKLDKKEIDRFLHPEIQKLVSKCVSKIICGVWDPWVLKKMMPVFESNENPYIEYEK